MNEPGEAPYAALLPDLILSACESAGLECDGCLLALNSYENRVYRVGIASSEPIVAKFYRPGRWTDAAILEEHAFAAALVDAEIPVVPPLELGGETLHHHEGFRCAFFPMRRGRSKELGAAEDLRCLGRLLGRMHLVGEQVPFHDRPLLSIEEMGELSVQYLIDGHWLPDDILDAYRAITTQCLDRVGQIFSRVSPLVTLRLHGDCHLGNILWMDDAPFFVDLDDCRTGPALQDLWMLLSGPPEEQAGQLKFIVEGYETFRAFPYEELPLIEALRTLRMLSYAAWLARRWSDPAFPVNFPWFDTQRYWEEQVLALKGQLAEMNGPALQPAR